MLILEEICDLCQIYMLERKKKLFRQRSHLISKINCANESKLEVWKYKTNKSIDKPINKQLSKDEKKAVQRNHFVNCFYIDKRSHDGLRSLIVIFHLKI